MNSDAAGYKLWGYFVRSYYDGQVAPHARHDATDDGKCTIKFRYPTAIDRVVLMEDQENGQVIRSYQVSAKVADSQNTNGTLAVSFTVSNGNDICHEKINIFANAIFVMEV
jgi:hypothetical protein